MKTDAGRLPTEPGKSLKGARVRWQPSQSALRLRLHCSLLFLDMACITCSFVFAQLVYPVESSLRWHVILAAILPMYLVMAFGVRAYSAEVISTPSRGVSSSMQALIVATSAILFLAFTLKSSEDFSRGVFALGLGTSAISLALGRSIFLRKARSILGGNPYTVILISDDPALLNDEYSTMLLSSSFDIDSHLPEMYDRLARSLKSADRVVVACALERRLAWANALRGANVQAEILAPELDTIGAISLSQYGGGPTVVIAKGPLNLRDRFLKRSFDLTAAVLAMLFFAPVLVLIAVAIKMESSGPVLFIQTRIGRANKMFRMIKFRSMRSEQSDGHGHDSATRDDVRITRIGRLIRTSSLDELPQLVNVILGDMSIVGPRPHALGSRAENKLFWEIDGRYWHRHATKPGLTGLAQVRGYRGATDRKVDLTNRLQADLEYLNDWTIWRDFKIIIMTFRVLVHKNAY